MSNQIEESSLKADKILRPLVSKPKKHLKPREGKGFSLKEIKSASIPLDDAQKLPISIDYRRKSIHDKNIEILSSLYRQTIAEKTEERIKLDISKKAAFKELKQLKGIKSNEAKLLVEAGVKSLGALIEEEAGTLADDTKIALEKIEKWIVQAGTLLKRSNIRTAIENLLQIKGMNNVYARKLVNFGILSVEDLSSENADILSKDLKISEKIIAVWIEDAMRLTGKAIPKKKKPAKLPREEIVEPPKKPQKEMKKPSQKPKELPKKVPDLKDIEGISKGDIKELSELGITTIQQLVKENAIEIASITGIDESTINNWIHNARELLGLEPIVSTPLTDTETTPGEVTLDPIEELLKLKGVGKKTAEKLVEAGVQTCADLIDCDPKELAKKSKVSEKTITKIKESAKNALE
ncbi:MAG: ribosomal protein L13e [Candidatus Helarchaeota archaeon]